MTYTILVPVEDTTWSSGFISHLNQLSTLENSEFVLLRVLPDLTGVIGMDIEQRLLEAEGMLDDCARHLDIPVDRIRFNIEMGKPDVVITQRAIIERADLVAMTTHARAGVSRILDGSVAESVMRVAPCPVLLCHIDVALHPEINDQRKLRVMVPVGSKHESADVLDAVIRLVPTENREIILYHSFTGTSEADNSGNSTDVEKAFIEQCRQQLVENGYQVVDIISSFKNPASDIAKKAREMDIDLVAMATQGKSGLSRLLFGSVAESILHNSACPLLTVSTAPAHEAEYRERYIG